MTPVAAPAVTIESQPIAAVRPPQHASSDAEIPGFEERWAAWQAKGRRQDRAGRRVLSIVVLIAGIVSVMTFYLFL
jgi:hypothetical protein